METIVVIPVYKKIQQLPKEQQNSILNTISKLNSYKLCVVGPEHLKAEYLEFYQVDYESFDDVFFQSINGYNRLLFCLHFYDRFIEYQNLVIVHSDAWVFEGNLEPFVTYDYIGAPWIYPPILLDKYDSVTEGLVGNGGLSLRNLNYVRRLLISDKRLFTYREVKNNLRLIPFYPRKLFSYLKNYIIFIYLFIFFNKIKHVSKYYSLVNEDVFFGVIGPTKMNVNMATPQVASKFAIETTTKYLMNQDLTAPVGCHSFAKRSREFWEFRLKLEGN